MSTRTLGNSGGSIDNIVNVVVGELPSDFIPDLGISTAKIADLGVTAAKIATDAVNESKLDNTLLAKINNKSNTSDVNTALAGKANTSDTVNLTGTQHNISGYKTFENLVSSTVGFAAPRLGSPTIFISSDTYTASDNTASLLYNDGGTLKFNGNEVTPALPTASNTLKGGVEIGANLTMTGDTLSVPEADLLDADFGVVKLGSSFLKDSSGKLFVKNATAAGNNAIPGCVIAGSGLSVGVDGTLSANVQSLPTASDAIKGCVKIGDNLTMTGDTLSVPVASTSNSGVVQLIDGYGVKINGFGNLYVEIASDSTFGGVKVGTGLSVTGDGTLSADVQPLATASDTTKGGVEIGANLTMTGDTLSVPEADTNDFGVVKLGSSFVKDSNGKLFVQNATADGNNAIPGCVKVGSGLSVTTDGTLSANVQSLPTASDAIKGCVKIGANSGLSITGDTLSVADSIAGDKTFTGDVTVNGATTLGSGESSTVTFNFDDGESTGSATPKIVFRGSESTSASHLSHVHMEPSMDIAPSATIPDHRGTWLKIGAHNKRWNYIYNYAYTKWLLMLGSGVAKIDVTSALVTLNGASKVNGDLEVVGNTTLTGNTSVNTITFDGDNDNDPGIVTIGAVQGSGAPVDGNFVFGPKSQNVENLFIGYDTSGQTQVNRWKSISLNALNDTTVSSNFVVDGNTTLGTQNGSNTHHFNGTHFIFDGSSTGSTRSDTPQLEINMIEHSGDANVNYVELIPGHSGHNAGQLFIGKATKLWNNMRLHANDIFSNGTWIHSTGNFTVNNGTLTVGGDTALNSDLTVSGNTTLGVAGTTDGTTVQTTTINGELIINGDKGVGSADAPGVKFTTTDYETSSFIGSVNVQQNNLVSTGLYGNMNIGSSSNRWQTHYIWSLFNRLMYTNEFSVGYNTTSADNIVLKCSGSGTTADPKKTEITGELTVSGDMTLGTDTNDSITFAGIPKLPIVSTLPSNPGDGSIVIHSYLDGSNGVVEKVKVYMAIGWVALN